MFLVILCLDFPHDHDRGEAILCKGSVAKCIYFKAGVTGVLGGIKCDLVKALCALTWEGQLRSLHLLSHNGKGWREAQIKVIK